MGQEEVTSRAPIRARLAQIEVLPGQPWENTSKMIEWIRSARDENVHLIVFPEMAVPGYLIADEWEREAFLRECEDCGEALREASRGMVVIFGNVALDRARRNEDGRVRKYNALFVADNGEFLRPSGTPYPFVIKTLLPNYREFDDSRHFFDVRKLALEERTTVEQLVAPVQTSVGTIGCMICEDLWDADYSISPIENLHRHNPDYFINISASPFTLNKNHKRQRVFSDRVRRLGRPLLYVNNVGIQNCGKNVFTFDGSSCVYDGQGRILKCGAPFTEAHLTCEFAPGQASNFGASHDLRQDGIAELALALDYGTRKFMELCGVSRVVIGVSGGIDSAVAAALYARIVPRENLLLANLPSRHNSPTTRNLAAALAANLGCRCAEVSIEDSVRLTLRQIREVEAAGTDGLVRPLDLSPAMLENVQARDRSARVLAALASAFGGVFTCNTNKTEATIGYGTLYGDITGFLANLADLWKEEVYALGRYLNEKGAGAIPPGCFDVTPSAELSPDQNVDEGKGDPLVYPYHDRLFRNWVESWNRTTPEEILTWYVDGSLEEKIGYAGRVRDLFPSPRAFVQDLERWWRLYTGMGVAKRIQAPPILTVKRRAFGFDHREAQMPPRFTRRYLALRDRLLVTPGSCA